MTYTANLTDPRVINKLEHIAGFLLYKFTEDTPEDCPKQTLDTHLGPSGRPMSKAIREHVLISNDSYSTSTKQCKSYTISRKGMKWVREMLQTKIWISFSEWQTKHSPITDEFLSPTLSEDELDLKIIESFIFRSHASELQNLSFVYEEKSNRLWNSLQMMPKKYRHPVFVKYGLKHDYDVSTCAPTLLIQYARKLGFTGKADCIDNLIENKREVRKMLSDHTGVPIDGIKTALNAIFAGGKLQRNSDCNIFAESFKCNWDWATNFKNCIFVQDLVAEIASMWKFICAKDNANTPYNSAEKWNLYFSLEKQVLVSAMSFMDGRNVKYFAIHDGFAANTELCIDSLEQHIYKQTGFNVKYDYTDLEPISTVEATQVSTDALEDVVELPTAFETYLGLPLSWIKSHETEISTMFSLDQLIEIYGKSFDDMTNYRS